MITTMRSSPTTTGGPWFCACRKRHPHAMRREGRPGTRGLRLLSALHPQCGLAVATGKAESGCAHTGARFQLRAHGRGRGRGRERQSIPLKFNISLDSSLWLSYLSCQVPLLGPSVYRITEGLWDCQCPVPSSYSGGRRAEGREQGACPGLVVTAGALLKKARADKKDTRTMSTVPQPLPGLLICSPDPAPLLGDCHLLPCYRWSLHPGDSWPQVLRGSAFSPRPAHVNINALSSRTSQPAGGSSRSSHE